MFRRTKNLQNLSDLTTFGNIKLGKAFSSGNRAQPFADVDSDLTLKHLFTYESADAKAAVSNKSPA